MPIEKESIVEEKLENSEKIIFPDDNLFFYDFEYNLKNIEDAFFEALSKRKFRDENKKRIRSALLLAEKLHRNQRRQDGSPYSAHPIEVALALLQEGEIGAAAICAALLHDIREDIEDLKKMSSQEFQVVFAGNNVENLTRLLSKYRNNFRVTDFTIFTPQADDPTLDFFRIAPQKLSKEEYFEKISESRTAVLIKAYDRISNLRSDGRKFNKIISLIETGEYQKVTVEMDWIENYLVETRDWMIPLVKKFYPDLAVKIEKMAAVIEKRCGWMWDLIEGKIDLDGLQKQAEVGWQKKTVRKAVQLQLIPKCVE